MFLKKAITGLLLVAGHTIYAADVDTTILVIARDDAAAKSAFHGLNGYGIPYTTLLVPQEGTDLPQLNSSTGGNFGGIVVESQVSYDYGGSTGFQSALTTEQWDQLYSYQLEYGVRMVQYGVYPGPAFGATANDACCDEGVEQLVSFSDISDFPTSGLKKGAGVSTLGLSHYPAVISDTDTTKEIAQFAANDQSPDVTTAAVINNFDGRQQMVFFIPWATEWSSTSNYLQHAWITWITRGLYSGYRRVNLNTQIDDMFLKTAIYPDNELFRLRPADLDAHVSWISSINTKLNPGSEYFPEIGHNGNGNIEASITEPNGWDICDPGPIEYDGITPTELEFKKPLGTGKDFWPAVPTNYSYSDDCLDLDSLKVWFSNSENQASFAHMSHTFTHMELNNATYNDAFKEIAFNIGWMKQVSFDSAAHFSSKGLIPPAITGMHNGDAIRAWSENGLTSCVGDNTRPSLRNQNNQHHPYITTMDADGFDGFQVNPRWSSRIYYNCDTAACTTQEWVDTSGGVGDFYDLLEAEKNDRMRDLFGLYRDAFMFHQANLRQTDVEETVINGESAKLSIFQAWVETVVQEFVRLVDWPILTLKHDDMSDAFAARAARDACGYSLTWVTEGQKITGVTVSAAEGSCGSPIPVTFPSAPTNTQDFKTEQVGNDPLTVWVQLSGSPVSFTLETPIPW